MMGLELAYGRARDIIGRERAECLVLPSWWRGSSSLPPGARSGCRAGRVPRVDLLRRDTVWRRSGALDNVTKTSLTASNFHFS
jgi:hypothetical protein